MDNTIAMSNNLVRQGFSVIIDDVVYSEEQVKYYRKNLSTNNVTAIVLLPSIEKLLKTDSLRDDSRKMTQYISDMYKSFQNLCTSKEFTIYDNSNEGQEESAVKILKILEKDQI